MVKYNGGDKVVKGLFIKFYFKDEKTLVLVGENKEDADILGNSKWEEKIFKVGAMTITIISGDSLDYKATTKLQRELTNRERQVVRNYGIMAILKTSGNNYNVYFDSKEALNSAIKIQYILAGGLSFKLETWKKRIIIKQCQKCLKFVHKEITYKGTPVCMYCAGINPRHSHKECPLLGAPDQHVCHICKKSNENSNHYCGDKYKCKSYDTELKYKMTISGGN